MKTGYSIRTWKKRLFCPEVQLLENTQEYYREVVSFYYSLLIERQEFWSNGIMEIQRELEKLTVAGRDGRQPKCPLPFGKVPVYFRRSAINKAIAAVKATLAIYANSNIGEKEASYNNVEFPEQIQSSLTFFKGMYSDLENSEITLKLWNGQKWIWTKCSLTGRTLPEDGVWLSPTLTKDGKRYMLNIPVKQENSDARTAKERMAAGTSVCSVRFTNTDVFAMCCVLDADGVQKAVHSCRGGDAYRHLCRQLTGKISKSAVYTDKDNSPQPNKKYYMHLKHLSEHYAHQVSREIVDFAVKNGAGVIVLPIYDADYSRMALYKSGNFSPLHLSSRIRTYLQYKAWAEGIIILEVRAEDIAGRCAACGGKARKKGKQFVCENGHEGNRFLNDAKNLGRKCQRSFQKGKASKE